MSLLVTLLALLPTVPASAEPDPPPRLILELEPQFTGLLAVDSPDEIRRCGPLPHGAEAGLDGWIFDQPVVGGENALYIIAFVAEVETTPTPILIAVDWSGFVRIPFPAAAALDATSIRAQVQPLIKDHRFEIPGGDTLPEGVAAALIDGGAGGAWFQTPAGWALLIGYLRVDTEATAPATFSLTGVCLPAATPTPTPTPSPSVSISPTASGNNGSGLPVTGAKVAVIVAVGLLVLLAGTTMVWAARRRRAEISD